MGEDFERREDDGEDGNGNRRGRAREFEEEDGRGWTRDFEEEEKGNRRGRNKDSEQDKTMALRREKQGL